jgi:hypothetical protein
MYLLLTYRTNTDKRGRENLSKDRIRGLVMAVLVSAGVFGWVYLPSISGGLLPSSEATAPVPTPQVTPEVSFPTPQP